MHIESGETGRVQLPREGVDEGPGINADMTARTSCAFQLRTASSLSAPNAVMVRHPFACVAAVVAVVAVAGCDSTLDVRVWQYRHATFAEIYDADCGCETLAPPHIGQCGSFTDVRGRACSCDAPSTCIERARIERDGVTVATAGIPGGDDSSHLTAHFLGDFVGASLVLAGCDQDIRVQLAHEYPPAPTVSLTQDGTGETRVTWSSVPSIDFARVRVGTLYGQWCVVEPTQTSITLRGSGGASVTTIRELTVDPTALGEIHAYSATIADGTN